jgi:hypothetical protein
MVSLLVNKRESFLEISAREKPPLRKTRVKRNQINGKRKEKNKSRREKGVNSKNQRNLYQKTKKE